MTSFEDQITSSVKRFFQDAGFSFPALGSDNSSQGGGALWPLGKFGDMRVDMVESDKDYKVIAEVPGIPKENLKVEINNRCLCIEGEKKQCIDEKKETYHFTERRYGHVKRKVTLPEDADADAVTSNYENGILTLTIGKSKDNKSKKVIKI